MKGPHDRSERGAALVTVLMIIAAMSVVALGLTRSVLGATQRARALDGQAQLRLYAAAAEAVAEGQLGLLLGQVQGRLVAGIGGLGEVQTFQIDGGVLNVNASEATNCLDLNTLIRADETGNSVADEASLADYVALLEAVGSDRSEAVALGSALVDWMDTDSAAGPSGAENGYYAGQVPSYRTSGLPLADLSELRAIRGYSAEIVARLAPLVCTRTPDVQRTPRPLNVNTIGEAQAPLLVLAFSQALDLDEARRLIASRPLGGWPDVETLLTEPAVQAIAPDLRRLDRLAIVSREVEVSVDVLYRGQTMRQNFLFQALPGKPVRMLSRERVG